MESSSDSDSSDCPKDCWKCDDDNKVISIKFDESNRIIIEFQYSRISLFANSECCSTSWFEVDNMQNIIGKRIKYIYDSKQKVKLPPSGKKEYDKNHLIIIKFIDDTEYQFYLRNSSNGYYDGFLVIR